MNTQVKKLNNKIESLLPVVKKSINTNRNFVRSFLKNESENNQKLVEFFELQKNNFSGKTKSYSELIPIVQVLKKQNEDKDIQIENLNQENEQLNSELSIVEKIFKNLDPNALKAALVGLSIFGLPGMTQPNEIPYVPPGTEEPVITGRYGEMRETGMHGGSDLAISLGTPVRAISDGEIVDHDFERNWGNFVVYRSSDGIYHLYGHLQNGYRGKGTIKKGEIIGKVGMTGRTSGPHLHWETGNGWNGYQIQNKFDPLNRYSLRAPFFTQREEQVKRSTNLNNVQSQNLRPSSSQNIALSPLPITQNTQMSQMPMSSPRQSIPITFVSGRSNMLTVFQLSKTV